MTTTKKKVTQQRQRKRKTTTRKKRHVSFTHKLVKMLFKGIGVNIR